MIHKLKCWPAPFLEMDEGRKTVEVRRCDDRRFEVQDVLELREWRPPGLGCVYVNEEQGYTGRSIEVRITAITESAGPLALRGYSFDGCVYPLAVLSFQLLRRS